MKAEMIKYLRNLGNGKRKPVFPRNGICSNFSDRFDIYIGDLVDVSEWSEYSGCKDYPIQSPDKSFSSCEYYYLQTQWVGEYGASRRRLCLWIADEIEKGLKEK